MSQVNAIKDVAVVGGGHNGLACAAYLAKAGLDIVVLERRKVLGGAAVTEEPWPGYQISSASYVVSLLSSPIVRELGLERHGYRVSVVTPDYFVPYPDGSGLALWGDTARDAAEIAKFSAADADAFVDFDRYFGRVAHLLKDLLFVVPPNLSLGDLRRSCGPGRWRTPAPEPAASPEHQQRTHHRRPAAGRYAGRYRRSPPRPTSGPGTRGLRPASPCNRRGQCRTGPAPGPSPGRRSPRSSPTAYAGPSR
jgi:phytoene dehydrogenase-like protein